MAAERPALSNKNASRFSVLDAWRGISALMVVFLHAPVANALVATPFVRHGFLFVDFFFVLSGFVIAHAYQGRIGSGRGAIAFLQARFARVYPLHFLMLMLFLAYELALFAGRGADAAFQGTNSVSAFFANLFLLHAFGTVDGLGWNYPSWSISAEFGAYLVFAALTLVAGRRMVAAFAAVLAVSIVVLFLAVPNMDTTVSFGGLRCLVGFSCGVLLRRLAFPAGVAAPPAPGTRHLWTFAEVAILAAVVSFVTSSGHTRLSLAAPFVFTFAIYGFAHEAGAVSRLLKTRVFQFLGLASYSIYMVHAFIISRMVNVATVVEGRTGWHLMILRDDGAKVFAGSPILTYGVLIALVAATLVASALTWRFIERPFQSWLRPGRRGSATRSVEAISPAPNASRAG
ncbi:acyltransferase family protein [Consotaella salsifontis]|uniref:Peptidoglycan/LPS O-acetylase OafA/YrhL, contains acyltransferase and SGNH-hydrolase domains n=1 Tax=Consotaella salsifontis TaxID=1365950 RepID=A0A1T4TFV3_9HYPH|nr:acyltransferase [Consotaella salsifontis]SKA39089.1 Peptidoglycan/LPS O-acetylase OafA/YrhL, contains acyltransferase and SGNH-hydrolase domains [Consotaella salsifontis]